MKDAGLTAAMVIASAQPLGRVGQRMAVLVRSPALAQADGRCFEISLVARDASSGEVTGFPGVSEHNMAALFRY